MPKLRKLLENLRKLKIIKNKKTEANSQSSTITIGKQQSAISKQQTAITIC
jgi:hypothetical protein